MTGGALIQCLSIYIYLLISKLNLLFIFNGILENNYYLKYKVNILKFVLDFKNPFEAYNTITFYNAQLIKIIIS